jgi:hypothetical protein
MLPEVDQWGSLCFGAGQCGLGEERHGAASDCGGGPFHSSRHSPPSTSWLVICSSCRDSLRSLRGSRPSWPMNMPWGTVAMTNGCVRVERIGTVPVRYVGAASGCGCLSTQASRISASSFTRDGTTLCDHTDTVWGRSSGWGCLLMTMWASKILEILFNLCA